MTLGLLDSGPWRDDLPAATQSGRGCPVVKPRRRSRPNRPGVQCERRREEPLCHPIDQAGLPDARVFPLEGVNLDCEKQSVEGPEPEVLKRHLQRVVGHPGPEQHLVPGGEDLELMPLALGRRLTAAEELGGVDGPQALVDELPVEDAMLRPGECSECSGSCPMGTGIGVSWCQFFCRAARAGKKRTDIAPGKLRKGGEDVRSLKPFVATLWVTNPTRQGLASHRKRVLRRRHRKGDDEA